MSLCYQGKSKNLNRNLTPNLAQIYAGLVSKAIKSKIDKNHIKI